MISKAFRQAYAHYYMLCIVYAQWHDQRDFKIERTCSRLQWRSKAWKENFRFRVPTLSTHMMDASTLFIKLLKQTRSFA
jgi:hypothetical protein